MNQRETNFYSMMDEEFIGLSEDVTDSERHKEVDEFVDIIFYLC